jgi:hypothetical protein
MKIRSLGFVFTFLAVAVTATAQKTVTNADLERYRAERVQARSGCVKTMSEKARRSTKSCGTTKSRRRK